jgi:predicted nucleic acid-binding protein
VAVTGVFVDACVWHSRTLRDWLGVLYTTADSAPFAVFWSEDVLAEVVHGLRRRHPDWPGRRITELRDRVARTFENGRVDDFVVDGSYRGADPLDAHVHAATVACRASILLTLNNDDFVWDANTSAYEVMHPDDFFVSVDDADPWLVADCVTSMCQYWVDRTGEADLPARLRGADCPQFAARVLDHLHQRL